MLIMAISGGAILPLIWGKLSDSLGSQDAYWIVVPAYLVILFYAVKGLQNKKLEIILLEFENAFIFLNFVFSIKKII